MPELALTPLHAPNWQPLHQATPALRLGKLPAQHDPRTLMLADYLKVAQLPQPPVKKSWSDFVKAYQMFLNDKIGDCTCATAGHMINVWSAAAGKPIVLTNNDILNLYERVSGYDPNTGQNDNGANEQAVLNEWRKNGVGGNKLGAYASVVQPGKPLDEELLQAAIWLFGGAYIGVELPLAAQHQQVWDAPRMRRPFGQYAPGSWGGHAVPIVDYDDSTGMYTVVTWGGLQQATSRWIRMYMSEAYALLDSVWFNGENEAPSGFDLATLQKDLAGI